jgi:threonine/homoserine/homoserine lactone efflux protein
VIAHPLAFVAVSILVILVPGPDMALVARNALRGRRAGSATGAGVVTGLAVWGLAASLGLAALLHASAPAFWAVKLAGGAYLAYLGVLALRDAVRRRAAPARGAAAEPRRAVAYRQGLLNNLGNPKAAVIFTSILPQFMPAHSSVFLPMATLTIVFCAMTLAWLLAYAALVARAGDLLRRGPLRRALDALTGVVLLALGGRIALERR